MKKIGKYLGIGLVALYVIGQVGWRAEEAAKEADLETKALESITPDQEQPFANGKYDDWSQEELNLDVTEQVQVYCNRVFLYREMDGKYGEPDQLGKYEEKCTL